ncbi:Methyltransferase domain-containing protein [Marinobacter gudaonensis]|uniref:Methyltransferase domain-containing protein n=1 Tax=Marinobacter gudaonensis TaxID=375760 RepID=A0A1I6GNW0_9GAMM|nr:class I SAM-dependent methyltransferase [Marinobacter gudaonensis]SFR43922.1 Methyltransferase domain-containing protein [Marinobacter gudaonensis]
MSTDKEADILAAWRTNAKPWIHAVEQAGIRGANSLTSQAILAAIRDHAPAGGAILDAGCGEGWLVRELDRQGYRATGTDAVRALVDHARKMGSGQFHTLSYDQLASAGLGRFDCVVSNFALLGDTSVSDFFDALPALLMQEGRCLIQTLHPVACFTGGDYRDGWKPGTWAGLPGEFEAPAPWYFRTLAGWIKAFTAGGMKLTEIREPSAQGESPQSIIFVAENNHQAP